MTDLLLYGHPDSGHACKVALALRLAGRAHETRFVDIWAPPETRPADFLAANPAAEVPCLMIDATPFVQSGAILREIASRFGCLGTAFPPGAVDWLKGRYAADCARFDLLLGDAAFLHGDRPGIGDCAVWGYTQWLEKADLEPSPAMERWRTKMRALPAMAAPEAFFPA